jgi:8-amino-7-oxononanoate synthase
MTTTARKLAVEPTRQPNQARPPVHEVSQLAASELDPSNFFWGTGHDPFDIVDAYDEWWAQVAPQGYYLFGQPMVRAPRPRTDVIEQRGKRRLRGLINLASYNYLGLSYRPEVIEAACSATRRYGTGASGSPVQSGCLALHEELSAAMADFKGTEACLLYSSGYAANVGVISALMRPGDLIVTDRLSHASIIDGIVLSKAEVRYFRHNDAEDLDRKLRGSRGRKLVVVEGVYSMDGDLADLPAIVEVARRHEARLMIDEAHSAFVFGQRGRGVAEHFGLEDAIDIHMGTFSKSLGGQGGYVVGSRKLIRYLRSFGRAYLFSCALAPAVAGGLIRACALARSEPELRERLRANTSLMQSRLREHGVDLGDSASQILPVMVRDDRLVFRVAEELMGHGVYVNPVRYPAVGKNKSRLRVSVTAAHTPADLLAAADVIAGVLARNGVPCR